MQTSKKSVTYIQAEQRERLIAQRQSAAMSKGEQVVYDYLMGSITKFQREYTCDSLTNPATGYPLFIDFYIPTKRLAIEVDGAHHQESYYGSDYQSQADRDGIKNHWCKKNGITMLRLTYSQLGNLDMIMYRLTKQRQKRNQNKKKP